MPLSLSGTTGIVSANIQDGAIQTVDISDGAITSSKIANGAVTPAKLGGINTVLQVVSTTLTTPVTITSHNVFVDVTGLSVSITPFSVTSKILISATITGQGSYYSGFRLVRDSTNIAIGTGSVGNRTASSFQNFGRIATDTYNSYTGALVHVDSPNTTSLITYKIQGAVVFASSGYALYVNRSSDDADVAYNLRSVSAITAIEIGA